MIKAVGYATKHSFSRLKPLEFEREEAGPNEVEITVTHCGVCHFGHPSGEERMVEHRLSLHARP